MPTLFDIQETLKGRNLISSVRGDPATEFSSCSTPAGAGPGDLSWLSPRVGGAKAVELAGSFLGAVLIVPADLVEQCTSGKYALVGSSNPRLAFTLIAARLFAHECRMEWPSQDESPVSSDLVRGSNVRLSHGVVVGRSVVLGDDVSIGPNTVLANCTIAAGVTIGANCTIGLPGYGYEADETGAQVRFPHLGRVTIAKGVEIGSNTCIDRGALSDTVLEEGVKVDNLVHIAHNVVVGRNSMLIANAMIGGSTRIGASVWVAPGAHLRDGLTVGEHAVIGLGAVVTKDVPARAVVYGNPAKGKPG